VAGVNPKRRRTPAEVADLKEQILSGLRRGLPPSRVCDLLSIPISTYEGYRQKDPEFRARATSIRASQSSVEGDTTTYDGGFTSFRKVYFGYDTYYHQQMIVNAIRDTPEAGVTMVLVPPEHGKTSLIEDYCNYMIAMDPNVRITIVSEGQPHARKILNRIKRRMVDLRIAGDYIARFGPFYGGNTQEAAGKPWAADMLTVIGADHDERDYTLEARGWTSAIAGTRTDLLIVDDIQSGRSLNRTDKMVDIFRQDFLTRPGKTGKTIIVGTRVGVGDFYEKLILEGVVDEVVELPALNEKGESLCPEMWNEEQLAQKRRKVGEDAWWRNYMQQPRRSGAAAFPSDLVDSAKDWGRGVGKTKYGIRRVVGLDPALTGGNAMVCTAYSTDRFEVLDALLEYQIGSVEVILQRIEAWAILYNFDVLVVEENAFQKGLVYDDRLKALARQYGFIIHAHTTGRNKLDEDLGVARMPSSFIAGQVSIPWADTTSIKRMETLCEQLMNWRPHASGMKLRQDLVMAFWFCWLDWQSQRVNEIRRQITPSITRQHRLPYTPTRVPLMIGARR